MYFNSGKMGNFKLLVYNTFDKILKLFCFSILVFFLSGCAKIADPSPLRADYAEPGETVIPPILITGTVVEKRDSVGVQKYDEASWINLQFKGEIDTTSRGFRVFNIAGEEVSFTRKWDVSPRVTELILKPGERLNYNTVYMLKVSGTEIYKLKGEYVDINNNGVLGEAVADGFVFPFVTFKTDNSRGEWKGITVDKIPPFITSSVQFLIEGKPTDYVWTDVDIALNIYDYTWKMADTSIIFRAVDAATLNKSKFKIIDENSKKELSIKDIDYIGDRDSVNFGRVLIDPADNLKPERFYILRVLGGISDSSGNKLGKVGSVVFEKRFKTFSCNHDRTKCVKDTTAPVVLNWRNLGPSFEVSFSELIDLESVTKSSVYIPDAEGELSARNECGQTFVRYTTLKRQSIVGHTAFVTGEVKDLAGNKVKEVSYYFERGID
jgi:hypothetical protein